MKDAGTRLGGGPRLFGVLVTFQRPGELAESLAAIASQSRHLDGLVVVDNDPNPVSASKVGRFADTIPGLIYLPSRSNLDAAGGRSLGSEIILGWADDSDWVIFFDDDDPLPTSSLLGDLVEFAIRMKAQNPSVGGVGLRGARMSPKTGRLHPGTRLGDGSVSVDHLHGGFFSMYEAQALRTVGSFCPELVWGREELELGLRMTHAGFKLYEAADLYDSVRHLMGHPDPLARPRLALTSPSLRRYFALRNHLYILRTEGLPMQAASWAVAGLIKPVVSLPIRPRRGLTYLRMNFLAIRDGWMGRLGPRVWRDGRVTPVSGANEQITEPLVEAPPR